MSTITLESIGPASNARCLDHLAAAAKYRDTRYLGFSAYDNACEYWHVKMNGSDRLAFDCFLVRMRDELAMCPGTPIHRFASRVQRMVEATLK